MDLTDEQSKAVEMAVNTDKMLFKIGGYAGTGKTTVLKAIVDQIPDIAVCAFAGKAASVLRGKGVEATTIHSRIYKWSEADFTFYKVDKVPYKRWGIDESSMVGADIAQDLQSFNLPIIAIGDPGQLEPVGKDINWAKDPDVILTKIHRQALDNPIINLATAIRTGQDWHDSNMIYNEAYLNDFADWADVVICGYNKTRVALNKFKRRHRKDVIEPGERIICLSNNRSLGVFNGLMFTVLHVNSRDGDYFRCNILGDDDQQRNDFPIWIGSFGKQKSPDYKTIKKVKGMIADYGYAITCHKAQGSEWDKVVVYNQEASKLWNQDRWLYTAVTRASKELRLII